MANSITQLINRKPRPDFPLFPHATGRWAKKVRGKFAEDPKGDAALVKWLDQRDDLLAGRIPRAGREGLTIERREYHHLGHLAKLRTDIDPLARPGRHDPAPGLGGPGSGYRVALAVQPRDAIAPSEGIEQRKDDAILVDEARAAIGECGHSRSVATGPLVKK